MSDDRAAAYEVGTPEGVPGGMTPAVQWFLAANIVVYFVQLTLLGSDNVASWLALSSADFPERWWGLGTYMFVHAGFVHLAVNMFMLWMFGRRLEEAFGTRAFTNFYLWCGLGGGVFHLLFARHGVVVGASGAVVGVMLAYALRWPDEELYLFGFIPLRARWLAVWMIALNVGMAIADASGATHSGTAWMAHVGGLAFAWLALHAPTGESLDRIRQHVATTPDVDLRPVPKHPRRRDLPPKNADEAVARSNALTRRRSANPPPMHPTPTGALRQLRRQTDEVNALLDKISRLGIESLTPSERRLLEEMSRHLRDS